MTAAGKEPPIDPPLGPLRTSDIPLADPYPHYRRYREADPVHFVPAAQSGTGDTYYLFAYEDVTRVLSSRRFGRGAGLPEGGGPPAPVPPGCPNLARTVTNWMVFMDPPQHTRLRALVAGAFSPRVVEQLRLRIQKIAADLVGAMRGAPLADLVDAFAAPLPVLVISELLGVPGEHLRWFRARAVDLQGATSSRAARSPGAFALADAAARDLDAYFRDELARRRGRPDQGGEDLIAALMRAGEDEHPLSDDELVGTCIHLLTAGHETTTNLLAKGTLALLAHPEQLAELRERPELLPGAVEELVRYDSPVQMITRRAYEDTPFGGRTVPAGARTTLVLGSANRDPARFDDPDRLDIHRDARRHCGFGAGAHYCVGAPLARLEAEIGLGELLRGLPRLALSDEPVTYAQDLVFHGPSRLVLATQGRSGA